MAQLLRYQHIILAIIFTLAVAAMGYFIRQLKPDSLSPQVGFLAADKGYGLTINLTQYDDKALVDTLVALRHNNLLWLRQPILWSTIEPAPGQFNWGELDRIFSAIAQSDQAARNKSTQSNPQNFKIIAVLYTTPIWARPPHTPPHTVPLEVSDFGRFAYAFAQRYGQQIDHYQIWHQPNISANWGYNFVHPPTYANLLHNAALNIRNADADALILTGALAPTLENGPLNLNETEFLKQLYELHAQEWFDIVAGQPYGFDFDPSVPANPGNLNFKRLELLRQVMLTYGDAHTPIWATAFGWNALPANWTGRPSPWRDNQDRYDPPALQAQRTADALKQARQNWPWLGPILAIRWDSTGLDADDPTRGFALAETPLLEPFRQAATALPIATIGQYPANHPGGHYSPGWRITPTLADIPRHKPQTLTIFFEGTQLDLTINRGPYRGYLWITIDNQPANALPKNKQGHSYVVLYDPLQESQTVTLAQNLKPGLHKAIIKAEGGWGQWAISGWTVSNNANNRLTQMGLIVASIIAIFSGLGLIRHFLPQLTTNNRSAPCRLGLKSQANIGESRLKSDYKTGRFNVLSPILALSFSLGLTPRVEQLLATITKRIGAWSNHPLLNEKAQVTITFALALAFYLAPTRLAIILLLPLTLSILYRPDLGLALIAFNLSFFQAPKQLPTGPFHLTETTLILTTIGFGLRILLSLITNNKFPNPKSKIQNLKSLDWSALALLGLSLISTLAASNFGVSMFEWRTVILGPVIYYFLIRLGSDFGPPAFTQENTLSLRWVWRLLDAFVAGAVCHTIIVLYHYFSTDQFVVTEGVRRALSPVYASPNNLALFLGRVWPILLAITILPQQKSTHAAHIDLRRWFYGGGLGIVTVVLYLTFSKGALLLGLPSAIVAMAILYLYRNQHHLRNQQHHWCKMLGFGISSLIVIIAALIPLSSTTRFRTIFDVTQGSGFFRLKLWQASLNMFSDYWLLGVGLNNFLYQYRTRYMLPEAWQEPNLSHPHNLILDHGTRLGLGGVVILFWLQGAFWLNAWRLYQKLPEPFILGLMGSMAVFLSHGLIDNAYFLVDLAFTFFLTLGIMQRLAEQSGSRK